MGPSPVAKSKPFDRGTASQNEKPLAKHQKMLVPESKI